MNSAAPEVLARGIMKEKVPWWIKLLAKLTLSRVPIAYSFWQRIGLFRHGQMDDSNYAIQVFEEHMKRAGLRDLSGKTLLELGPGDSVATALLAYSHGARAILLDSGDFASQSLESINVLKEAIAAKGLPVPDFEKVQSRADVLHACGATYLCEGLASFENIESNSVDFIFSQAVLEHIPVAQFSSTQVESFRVLKASGLASHVVDLKDHLGGSLNNLRFSERCWESNFFTRSGFYTNRIRFDDIIKVFEASGFDVVEKDTRVWSKLPLPKSKMALPFRNMSYENLSVRGFDVVLKKCRQ